MKSLKEVLENKSLISFLKRAILFLVILIAEIFSMTLFLDFSGLNLEKIGISTDAHLIIYIFILVFLLMTYKDIKNIKKPKDSDYRLTILMSILNILSLYGFYSISSYMIKNPSIIINSPLRYVSLWWISGIATGIFLLFALFEFKFIKYFIKTFKRELLTSFGLSIAFLLFSKFSQKLWPLFAKIVGRSVYFMLSLFFKDTRFWIGSENIPIVGIPAITAKIYSSCSGIEGMGLFLLLFTVLILIEYKHLNIKKVIFLYPTGVLGAFIINITRTFLIFVMGHYTSAEFAVGAFHSNIGWILFTIYFLIFIYYTYPWMRKDYGLKRTRRKIKKTKKK